MSPLYASPAEKQRAYRLRKKDIPYKVVEGYVIVTPNGNGKTRMEQKAEGIKILNRIARNRGTKKEDIDYLVDLILTL